MCALLFCLYCSDLNCNVQQLSAWIGHNANISSTYLIKGFFWLLLGLGQLNHLGVSSTLYYMAVICFLKFSNLWLLFCIIVFSSCLVPFFLLTGTSSVFRSNVQVMIYFMLGYSLRIRIWEVNLTVGNIYHSTTFSLWFMAFSNSLILSYKRVSSVHCCNAPWLSKGSTENSNTWKCYRYYIKGVHLYV